MSSISKFLVVPMLALFTTSLCAQDESSDDLFMSFGDEDFVSIATGQKKHISKAPAVASVITQEEMKSLGITTLEQALELVPGVHVSNPSTYNPIYVFRGIYSQYNPQVLVLINGIPITNIFIGDRNQVWGHMSIQAVERIEVIRGPGSAVYGADAFAGVVNIVTKSNSQAKGEAGVRTGSFDTHSAWINLAGKLGPIDSVFSLEIDETDGQDSIISSDQQTVFDSLFGTDASLAPDRVNVGIKTTEMRLDLSNQYWRFRAGYQGRSDGSIGAGLAQALDNRAKAESDRYSADVTYNNKKVSENWQLTAQLSWLDTTQETDITLFPANTVLPIGQDGNIGSIPFGGFVYFPNGVQGNPYVYEQHTRFNVDAFYTGFNNNTVRIGAGVSRSELQAKERKNYGPGVINGTEMIVDGSLTDVTGTPYAFLANHDRDISYVFVQDEWSFSSDWATTIGVRYDDYSDFGGTLNPRFALVWQAAYNMTAKLLYGRAFRAPSFAEQYNQNNPISTGNPNLDPETIDTLEIVLDYTSENGKIHTIFNVFVYEMRDIIRHLPDPAPATTATARNFGGQDGRGFEWELRWNVNNKFNLFANYAYQKSEDILSDIDVANAPGSQFYLNAKYQISSSFSLAGQVNSVMDRKRASGDIRPEVDDYTSVDLILRYIPSSSNHEFAVSVRNTFDEDMREPSAAPGVAIPNDLPLAGRSAYAEYRFLW